MDYRAPCAEKLVLNLIIIIMTFLQLQTRNGLSKLINIPHDWITTLYIISYFVIATDSYFRQ